MFDARVSFLTNITHYISSGTWGRILDILQILSDQNIEVRFNEKSQMNSDISGSIAWIIDKWMEHLIDRGLFNDVSGLAYSSLILNCYNDLIIDYANDDHFKTHAVCANLWHPFPLTATDLTEEDLESDNTSSKNNSFIAANGSILNSLDKLYNDWNSGIKTDLSWNWVNNNGDDMSMNNILYNSEYNDISYIVNEKTDGLIIGGTRKIWDYIIDKYNLNITSIPSSFYIETGPISKSNISYFDLNLSDLSLSEIIRRPNDISLIQIASTDKYGQFSHTMKMKI